jgi:ABC-type iron transport system FetAB ATPase subunit
MAALLTVEGLESTPVTAATFEIAAGECLCISGRSGSGKTRLLRALADLDPHTGEIRLSGRRQREIAPNEWRRRVALLPAEAAWWASTVGEHNGAIDARALTCLGLPLDAASWPVERLSAGEKQRLALLRLTAGRKPDVLLLDEPTANLDPDSADRAERYLLALAQERGVAIVWVSHDAAQIGRVGTRAMRIESGRLEIG